MKNTAKNHINSKVQFNTTLPWNGNGNLFIFWGKKALKVRLQWKWRELYRHRFFPWWVCKWGRRFLTHGQTRRQRKDCRGHERRFWGRARRSGRIAPQERPSSWAVAAETMSSRRGSASCFPSFFFFFFPFPNRLSVVTLSGLVFSYLFWKKLKMQSNLCNLCSLSFDDDLERHVWYWFRSVCLIVIYATGGLLNNSSSLPIDSSSLAMESDTQLHKNAYNF